MANWHKSTHLRGHERDARSAAPIPELSVVTLFGNKNTAEIFRRHAEQLKFTEIPVRTFDDLSRLQKQNLPGKRVFVHDGSCPPSLQGRLLMIRTHWHFRAELSFALGSIAPPVSVPLDLSQQRRYELSATGVNSLLHDATRALTAASQARRSLRARVVSPVKFSLKLLLHKLYSALRRSKGAGTDKP